MHINKFNPLFHHLITSLKIQSKLISFPFLISYAFKSTNYKRNRIISKRYKKRPKLLRCRITQSCDKNLSANSTTHLFTFAELLAE